MALCEDREPPEVIVPSSTIVLEKGVDVFNTSAFSCYDEVDGYFRPKMNVDVLASLGRHVIHLVCIDEAQLQTNASITVVVQDTISPVMSLRGPKYFSVAQNSVFTDPGVDVVDAGDPAVLERLRIEPAAVDTSVPQTIVVTYSVSDASGNEGISKGRFVYVTSAQTESDALDEGIQKYLLTIGGIEEYQSGMARFNPTSAAVASFLEVYRSSGGNLSTADVLTTLETQLAKLQASSQASEAKSDSAGYSIVIIAVIVAVVVSVVLTIVLMRKFYSKPTVARLGFFKFDFTFFNLCFILVSLSAPREMKMWYLIHFIRFALFAQGGMI